MNFQNLLNVVKASQIATLQTQIIMLTQLQENTDTDYSVSITAINAQITALNTL